jgi:hypothetical protein
LHADNFSLLFTSQGKTAPSPHEQGIRASSNNPRYQSVSRNDDSSRRRGGPSPPSSNLSPSSQGRRPNNDLVNEADYGPYSHMESSSMGSKTLKGSLDSKSKSGSTLMSEGNKYNVGMMPSNYKGATRKTDPEADDFLVRQPQRVGRYRTVKLTFSSCDDCSTKGRMTCRWQSLSSALLEVLSMSLH